MKLQNISKELEIIDHLINSENISDDDLSILNRVLIARKTSIKVSLIDYIVNNIKKKDEFIDVINFKINQLLELGKELEANGYGMIDFIDKKVRQLKWLAENIKHKEYKKLIIDTISDDIHDMQSLIDVCSLSLGKGYNDYVEIFGSTLVSNSGFQRQNDEYKINGEIIDKVFDIVIDDELFSELIQYYNLKLEINRCDQKIEELYNNLGLDEFVKQQSESITRYEKLRKSNFEENERILKQKLRGAEAKLRDLSKDKLSRLLNKRKIGKLKNEIKQYLNEQHQNSLNLNEFNILKIKFADYDIDTLIEKNHLFLPSDGTIDFKFEKHKKRIKSRIELEKNTKKTIETKLSRYIENMSSNGKNLVINNPDDICKIISLVNGEKRYGRTPIICMYSLKILRDLMNMSFEDIQNMINSDNSIKELNEKYCQIINEQFDLYEDNIDSIIGNLQLHATGKHM